MKKMKRVLALVFAMILTVAMAVPVFATQTNGDVATPGVTLTIQNTVDGHTYAAYQILDGDVSKNASGEGVIANAVWGTGVSAATVTSGIDGKTAAQYAEYLDTLVGASTATLQAEADKLAALTSDTYASASHTEKSGIYTISNLDPGYYLVIDTTTNLQAGESEALKILMLIGDDATETVVAKSGTVTVEKKVIDINDSTEDEKDNSIDSEDWQDSADYDIGDVVDYKLTGTLPANYDSYDAYYYEFSDQQNKGLTFNDDFVVYAVNGTSAVEIAASSYTKTVGTYSETTGTTLNIVFDDLKKAVAAKSSDTLTINANTKIVVKYTSTVNANAVIGSAGNPNKVKLIFSNNPTTTGHGETNWDTVIVFTYKVVVNKVNEDAEPLEGAEFTLTKTLKDGTTVDVAVVKSNEGTTFSFKGLDDGIYTLTETVTPTGYNTIDPITFTVTADHDILSDAPKLNSLSGNATTGAIELTMNASDEDALTADVVNNTGSILPHTGGAGRVALYVVGGIIVIAVGVILVTLFRTKKNA